MQGTKHRMAILNDTGHTLLEYDVENEKELDIARREFYAQQKLGNTAFKQPTVGLPEMIQKFNPNDESILFLRPMVGG